MLSFPVVIAIVLVQAGLIFGGDRFKQWREESRPLPPAGSPNVLLIVLDTVRADHLSLYGYQRPTSPALERLASRGVRFDQARAAAPWTLASHATMFTGRWPHELAIRWMYPLRRDVPTLAEFVVALGYATAGFVANTLYCSYDSGLDRGFTHYEDYVLDKLSAVRTCHLVDLTMKKFARLVLPWHRVFRSAHSYCPAANGSATVAGSPEGCRSHQSRIPRLDIAPAGARPAVLRIPELCRRTFALCVAAGRRLSVRLGT